jgi:hypothetical protein
MKLYNCPNCDSTQIQARPILAQEIDLNSHEILN